MGVIFVAGVHAVGKTTAIEEASRECGVPFYSASSLIKNEKQAAIPEKGKVVADIGGNQELLVRGVNRVVRTSAGRILLDGHFTLQNLIGEIEKIDVDVFRMLGLESVVAYLDDPVNIANRLAKRDGEIRSAEFIARHQEEELSHAQAVASQLGVPLVVLNAFDTSGLIRILCRLSE